jgi:hypothetical protein
VLSSQKLPWISLLTCVATEIVCKRTVGADYRHAVDELPRKIRAKGEYNTRSTWERGGMD